MMHAGYKESEDKKQETRTRKTREEAKEIRRSTRRRKGLNP
jgi:hypothetical protein